MSLGSLLPGVPQLPLGAATPGLATIASEAVSGLLWQASQVPPAWGVFDDQGNQVVSPDSVLDLTHRTESDLPTFPVQDGQFANYNKVAIPFTIMLRFAKGGSVDDRIAFLADIDGLYQSIELYTVVSPERTYQNLNLQYYEIRRRGPQGAYFLQEVDLYFKQILQVTAQYTTTPVQLPNSQSSSALPTSNVGAVNPQAPDSALSSTGNSALSDESVPSPEVY